jgi:glycerol-3-phosphate acyltransferase PlsY
MPIELMMLCVLGAFIVGSIPLGYILGRLHGIDDIRRYGSGFIGATNVGRILGIKYFFLILLLDACKAYLYISCCTFADVPRFTVLLCAFALLLGNSYSLFLGGSGGKGVATTAGIMLALSPMLCFVAFTTWLIAFYMLRTVGIASVVAALLLPLYAVLCTDMYGFLFILVMAAWVIWRHRSNIYLFYMVK